MSSIVNYVADGSTTEFQIPFTYISEAHVVVTIDGTATTAFTFLNSSTLQMNTAPSAGAKIQLQRTTPTGALVDFTDGSTLFETDLDLAHQQNRLIAEESKDIANVAKTTIDNNIDDVNTVAGIAADVTNVSSRGADVTSVADNMAEVLLADTNAATATTKAAEAAVSANTASAQAVISTTKATESSASAAAALASQNAAQQARTDTDASEALALAYKNSAQTSASTATTKASEASQSATTASSQAAVATTKATEASTDAGIALAQAAISTTKAAEASTSESNALSYKDTALAASSASETARAASVVAKDASQVARTGSEAARDAAAASETAAATSETNAAASEGVATTQAGISTTKAAESAASAAASLASQNAAATSETNSATSEGNAATSATASETSRVASVAAQVASETAKTASQTAQAASEAARDAAAASETAAATSETNAAASEASASADAATATTKAGEASTSASNAASSASSAQASKDAALAALDSFDDRYLGQKTADPTVDNDGNALIAGALYFNTSDDAMKVYEGSVWVAAYASLSGALLQVNNLSDVASASGARTNLGLVIGTNVQAFSAILANTTASYTTAEETKLAGIEAGATADQTAAQIKAAYESNSNTNEFSDAEQTKLAGIEAGATGDQSASEIRSLVEAATDSNVFTDADHSKLNAIEANAKDDQTITAGSGLTGGGTGNVTLNHADTSTVSNANNSGNTFIQDINFDGFGHVTSVGTGTVSVGNGTLTVQGTGALGGSGTFTANQSGNATISISHDDTSSQGSVNNSGATVIQDVTLDGYGHITGLASKTLTLADLGGSASANSIQGYSSAPAVPAEGGIYYNTTEDVLYISNGVSWRLLLDAPPTFTGGAFSQTSVSGASFSNNPRSYFSDDVTSNAQLVLTRSGSLPPGITETGDVISGTLPVVATATSYSFSYVATDEIGNTSPPKTYSINVNPPPPALATATGGSTFTHSGRTFYMHSGFSEFSFSVQPGGILYVAMIGATGGDVSGTRGGAGLGFCKIIIPTGVTTLYGSCGERGTGGSAGRRGGGTAGSGGGGYSPYQSGGAGYTGLFTSSSRSHSSILAMVGGGGSGGHAGGGGGTTYPKGGGGGFNLNGGNHQADGTDVAYGGTLTAGGVSVFGNRGYTSNNAGSGSALQGGRGSDGQYDAGGGGGAGYYGGAGGQGGGGVDGRGGGGGSGYLDLAHGSVLYALTGNHNTRANDLAIGISGSSAFDGNAIISQAVNLDYGGGDQYNSSENGEQGVMLLWS